MAPCTTLSAAQIEEGLNKIQEIPPRLRSRHAQVLADAGFWKKAERINDCGIRARMKAPDGCTHTIAFHCNTWPCPHCAIRKAKELLEKWHEALSQVMRNAHERGVWKFTLVTIHQPLPADPKQISRAFADLDDHVLELTGDDDGDPQFFRFLCGYVNGSARFNILYLDSDIETRDWRDEFPGSKVTVWYFSAQKIHDVFRDYLARPVVPDDAAGRGHQELLFAKVHRFSSYGIKRIKPAPSGAEAEGIFTVGNSPVNLPGPNLDCGLGKCPHGLYFNERTRWYPITEPIPPVNWLEWKPVPPLPIQT